jgi:hypothetical protein
MSLDWIRRNYLVPARRGARVAYDATMGAPRHGKVVGARQQYLKILMDGDAKPGLYHPTWMIRFIPTDNRPASEAEVQP